MKLDKKQLKNFGYQKAFDKNGDVDPQAYREATKRLMSALYKDYVEQGKKEISDECIMYTVMSLYKNGKNLFESVAKSFGGKEEQYNKIPFMGGLTAQDIKDIHRSNISPEAAYDHALIRYKEIADRESFTSVDVAANKRLSMVAELVQIRESRGFWWRFRHPVLNYRESRLLSNLKKDMFKNVATNYDDFKSASKRNEDVYNIDFVSDLNRPIVKFLYDNERFFAKDPKQEAATNAERRKLISDIVKEGKRTITARLQNKYGEAYSRGEVYGDRESLDIRSYNDGNRLIQELKDFKTIKVIVEADNEDEIDMYNEYDMDENNNIIYPSKEKIEVKDSKFIDNDELSPKIESEENSAKDISLKQN